MSRPALRWAPAALVGVALAWVLAADGPTLPAPVIVVTVVAAAWLAARAGAAAWRGPAPWLAGLLAWAALDTALRPVSVFAAARGVAAGAVALALLLVGARPRAAAWGRFAVGLAGAAAAVWMIAERVAHAARPAGPFGNPNGSATAAVLALALAPWLRPRAVAGVVGSLALGGVVASGSRGALLATAAIALVWALAGRRRKFALAAMAVVAVVTCGLAARLVHDRDPLRWERVRIWGVAARVAADFFPLGCGPGGYADAALARNFPLPGAFARYARLPDLPESDLLAVPAVLGVPGIVLAAGLAVAALAAARRAGAQACGVAVAIAVTSAVNSQLMVPAVAWLAALALGSVLGPWRPASRCGHGWTAAVVTCSLAVAAAVVLALPEWGVGPSPAKLVAAARAASRLRPQTDAALADAEALAWHACAARPESADAWAVLGEVRLKRAGLRHEAGLAAAAAAAYARARRANPLDVWAALGEGRAKLLDGDWRSATAAFTAAVRLEPNCAPAWLELAHLRLAQGEIGAARAALVRTEAIVRAARGRTFVTAYERAMASPDPAQLARLRAALGGRR